MIEQPSRAGVAVIGAGPHGLAAVAHLRHGGADVHAFGRPLEFWSEHMPEGMLLRSSYRACFISDPERELTLPGYERAHGVDREEPVSLERFIDYGRWFQQSVLPDVDERRVLNVGRDGRRFTLTLDDGSAFTADRVVVAAGIAPFARRPAEFSDLPPSAVSHAADHRSFAPFAGRRVLVVGAGQSALESAALLHEAGAETEVVARAATFRWNPSAAASRARDRLPSFVGRVRRQLWHIKYPPHDVGPWPWNWLVASPDLWRLIPRRYQPGVEYHVNYPRGASWLPPRLVDVPLRASTSIESVVPNGDELDVKLSDGTRRRVDHLLLGTGYRIDVSRYGFLGPDVLQRLRRKNGYPILRRGMESSVPGLYFVGAPAAISFGPSMRFVTGSAYGARAVASSILNRRPRLVDVAW